MNYHVWKSAYPPETNEEEVQQQELNEIMDLIEQRENDIQWHRSMIVETENDISELQKEIDVLLEEGEQ